MKKGVVDPIFHNEILNIQTQSQIHFATFNIYSIFHYSLGQLKLEDLDKKKYYILAKMK